ncbi:MAG: long-chain fatty acid--CoA ligase [Rhodocyclaceae bacterium]|nr:long-chain fatty acid--CoA ligase [Rhodocyclaceae bacterium]
MKGQVISAAEAGTLAGLFRERVRRSPEATAYRFYDALNETWTDVSWDQIAREVRRWQCALAAEQLQRGDRVAIMAHNSRFWVTFDQAALGLGLVVVPLYTEDRPDNVAYVLDNAGVKLLVIGGQPQWAQLRDRVRDLRGLKRIVSVGAIAEPDSDRTMPLCLLTDWLPTGSSELETPELAGKDLATIVYTSGTTGRPKGVMLTHWNLLSNAWASMQAVKVAPHHVFLSFLPLSHVFERTIGYYLPMMAGITVAHNRSIADLPADLQTIRPTSLITVPRIFERVHVKILEGLAAKSALARRLFDFTTVTGWRRFEYQQGRARWHPCLALWPALKRLVADGITAGFGGRLEVVISGGAALPPEVSRVFIALGIPILQGYGLTEASPVVSVNRIDNNRPHGIGLPLPGVEIRTGEHEELLVRGDNVMAGYWNNPEATAAVLDADGWLRTGDRLRIDDGHLAIIGRIKDIIVLSTGEKIPPVDMEHAISADPLFDQVMIIGEARPALIALVVLNPAEWEKLAAANGISVTEYDTHTAEGLFVARVARCLHDFPGYARIRRVVATREEWTVANGLLTPTLKIKRPQVQQHYADAIEAMYRAHGEPRGETAKTDVHA